MTLFYHEHLAGFYSGMVVLIILIYELIKVQTGWLLYAVRIAAVPFKLIMTGKIMVDLCRQYVFTKNINYVYGDNTFTRAEIVDFRQRIKWIRIILFQLKR